MPSKFIKYIYTLFGRNDHTRERCKSYPTLVNHHSACRALYNLHNDYRQLCADHLSRGWAPLALEALEVVGVGAAAPTLHRIVQLGARKIREVGILIVGTHAIELQDSGAQCLAPQQYKP